MLGSFPTDCLENSKARLEQLILDNKGELEALLSQKDKTYHNFIRPYMDAGERISVFFTPISHMQSVKNDERSQEAFTSCIGVLTAYETELSQDKRVYDAFVQIKDNEYSSLTVAQRKVLDDAIFHFQLMGVSLPESEKERIKEINIRKSELADEFSQNLLNATNAYKILITDESILGDMPDSDRAVAKVDNGWEFSLQMPSYIAFMTYVTDRSKREEVYRAYSTRAPENGALIEEILSLRAEKAEILGYKNFAELNLRTMSAPSVEAVLEFLNKLGSSGKPHALKDKEDLDKFAGIDIQSYDTAIYSEKLKRERFDYDEEELRPYFEQNSVLNGMFTFLERLFGIKFVQKDTPLWDNKATFYELYIKGELCGGLYMDLEARPEKRGGAWMNNWHTRHRDRNDKMHLPEAFVVANFPVSTDTQPSLLRHDDVTTLFHEMGHALHHLISNVDELAVSGINGIDWDVVEFPSQFLENFAYAPEVLDIVAKHYKTGEKLPKELLDKLVDSKNFQEGLALVRQLEFATFDMQIHLQKMNEREVQETLDSVRNKVAAIMPPEYNRFQNGFAHIFAGGYAAGYYSYKWAEMLSSDAYLEFMNNGIFNKKLADSYVSTILSQGATRKMSEIYKEFIGRNPDPEAILKIANLI
ncbi:MAG: M3 family metallopeptidase [Deferribacteraceae bacterium]|jgi:oligopeptidase A|nr:M3 family metallopeptidase [Deferribacteraceae bacterium]